MGRLIKTNGKTIVKLNRHDRRTNERRYISNFIALPNVPSYVIAIVNKMPNCPICGNKPEVEALWNKGEGLGLKYRLYCPENDIHIGYGTEQPSIAKATLDWIKRTKNVDNINRWYESEKDFA